MYVLVQKARWEKDWSLCRGHRSQSYLQCFLWSQWWGISCWCIWWRTPCPYLSGGKAASLGLYRSVTEEMIKMMWSLCTWVLSDLTFWQLNPWFFNTFSSPIMLLWVCLTWFHCNLFSEKVRKASLSEESVWILRLAEQIVDSNNAFHTSLNNKPQGDLGQDS